MSSSTITPLQHGFGILLDTISFRFAVIGQNRSPASLFCDWQFYARRKKNKEIHNAVERHRKEKINAGINRIGELLPCSQALKQSKNMILGEAFRYITELKRQNDEMLNGGDKVQAEEIKRLRHQLEDMRKESAHYIELLKANGINFLDDPTIHWKGKQRCAKVAKVTPTHLMSKGTIVYSDDNTLCPTSKVSIPPNQVSHLDKQPANAVTVQPACDITLAGHNINASSSSFGAFTFTSEQAEILARAIFEQDSPGKRAAGCSVDNPTSTAATGWDIPKRQAAPSNKDSATDQQVKLTKQADLPVSETSSQNSARVPPVEPLASGTTGIRLPQSIAYSQSQPSSVTSLNVNNLIRPSSNQPYPGSPNLAQQVSASSSGGAAVMVTQSSSQVPPTCSGPAQPNEYAPLKNALMRTHVGIGMVERHQKDMPKRSAQDDLILPNKRSKPSPAGNVARVDIKATDHVQMMVGQMPSSTSADPQSTKIRPGDRPRSGNLRPGNPFEPESSLPLPSGGGVILSRTQTGGEARRSSIVRFMADGAQVSSDNNLVSDRCAMSDLTQNFGFPFIAEGGMNPPPPINANASFIPPVTQPGASRTPALLPVEPQNTLPSFYPSYSPAAHPSLPSEIPLQYFSNQMFTSPSTDKSGSAPLNNRFGSILSPPRPVGFAQASFPLLTDITPMPIGNSSGITPHLSNFNLTSLFPEIATAMPPDGSSMPMSPLLSLANTTSSDSNKQSNRPAHNISHILGHDGTSAV
ncbi:hypothetical protein cypCar_00000095 [Cyprinus carpio]|nr:hypothetical protein cypCar_00000095 [Cyprinus carpio]